MTFLEFIDKQFNRFSTTTVAGAGIFLLTLIVLAMLFENPGLADNQLFSVLAQAIVVQGLVGLAMAAWFTKKGDEGTTETRIVNTEDNPVPVEEDRKR